MPGTISAPPVPRIPPNYGQTRNPEERGMWTETTDQYLLRISALGDPATDTAFALAVVVAFFLLMGNLKKGNPIHGK
jgi:hypothetical protein